MKSTFIGYYTRRLQLGNREGGFTVQEVEEILQKRKYWGYPVINDLEEEVLKTRKELASLKGLEKLCFMLDLIPTPVFERLEHTFLRTEPNLEQFDWEEPIYPVY